MSNALVYIEARSECDRWYLAPVLVPLKSASLRRLPDFVRDLGSE